MVKKPNKYSFDYRKLRRHLGLALRALGVLLGLAALSALFVAGYRTMLSSPLLGLTTVQVSGCQRLDQQAVLRQAAIPAGTNILSVDLDAVSQRVTSHPWVASAVIIREIPDRIRIQIQERQPVALVRGRGFLLADIQGVCFSRAQPAAHPGLPIISGLDPKSVGVGRTLPQQFTVLLQALYGDCRHRLPWRLISEIKWDRSTGLTLFAVRDGMQIALGTADFGPRLARLEKVLRYLEMKRSDFQLRSMDLRYGDRVFVKGEIQVFSKDRLQGRGV